PTNLMPNPILKQHVLKRLGAMKAQVVHIKYRFQTLGDLGVDAGVVNKDSGIDEVCLAFDLAAAQARQNAVRLHQAHAGLRQANAVAVPERELPADKIRIVENCVKTIRVTIVGVLITLREENRSAKSQVVMIYRRFDGRHVRADVDRTARDWILIVAAKRVVVTVRQVQASQMSIAVDANVTNLDSVWPHAA